MSAMTLVLALGSTAALLPTASLARQGSMRTTRLALEGAWRSRVRVAPRMLASEDADRRVALRSILCEANFTAEPEAVEEMSAGFCNWVYRVDLPRTGPVVVKLFSPLAKLRLTPAQRGYEDEEAGEAGLGPRVYYRSADGLVC